MGDARITVRGPQRPRVGEADASSQYPVRPLLAGTFIKTSVPGRSRVRGPDA